MATSITDDTTALVRQISTMLTHEVPTLEDRTRNAVMGQLEEVRRQLLGLQALMEGEQDLLGLTQGVTFNGCDTTDDTVVDVRVCCGRG